MPVLSPMPPRVKVVRIPIDTFNGSLQDPDAWRQKMLDELLLRTLVGVARSLGGGKMEQGRLGCALSKQAAVRAYLRAYHGEAGASRGCWLRPLTLVWHMQARSSISSTRTARRILR